jgi:hypothetical protein
VTPPAPAPSAEAVTTSPVTSASSKSFFIRLPPSVADPLSVPAPACARLAASLRIAELGPRAASATHWGGWTSSTEADLDPLETAVVGAEHVVAKRDG